MTITRGHIMSTAIGTTHHRLVNPIVAATAVVVIAGGATVIGVAMSQSDGTAPTNPTAPAEVNNNPPSRVGQGDFNQTQNGPDHRNSFRGGGHSEVGIP
jgi:hypothetical protein